jgi:hypothetical protein
MSSLGFQAEGCRLMAQRDVYRGVKECRPLGEERKSRSLIAEHSASTLDPHLVCNAGSGQARELGERRVRPA